MKHPIVSKENLALAARDLLTACETTNDYFLAVAAATTTNKQKKVKGASLDDLCERAAVLTMKALEKAQGLQRCQLANQVEFDIQQELRAEIRRLEAIIKKP